MKKNFNNANEALNFCTNVREVIQNETLIPSPVALLQIKYNTMNTNYNKIKSDLLAFAKVHSACEPQYKKLYGADSIEAVIAVVKANFMWCAQFKDFSNVLMANREQFAEHNIWIDQDVNIEEGVGFLLATEGKIDVKSYGTSTIYAVSRDTSKIDAWSRVTSTRNAVSHNASRINAWSDNTSTINAWSWGTSTINAKSLNNSNINAWSRVTSTINVDSNNASTVLYVVYR